MLIFSVFFSFLSGKGYVIYTLPGKFIFILYTQDGLIINGLDQNLNHPLPPLNLLSHALATELPGACNRNDLAVTFLPL